MARNRLPDPSDRPCISAEEAFTHLGIDRTTGYRAIKTGNFPLPVIRVGRTIRIPTAALLQLLAVNPHSEGVRSSSQSLPIGRSA